MKSVRFAAAVVLSFALAAPALADDPNDPAMRNAAARARDAAIIKRLNQAQLAQVRERDAGYAEGWAAYRRGPQVPAAEQARYEREMADWRHAVAACRSGDWRYCAR
jgi:hypothetical protein